jgi:four helix bundle protein
MQNFRNLKVWQKSQTLVLKAYAFSATLNHPRTFFLRDQLMRAAVSVPANLAEGCGRTGDRELRKFVRIALGSASELEYHLLLAHDLGFLVAGDYEEMANSAVEVKRMLSGLANELTESLRADS